MLQFKFGTMVLQLTGRLCCSFLNKLHQLHPSAAGFLQNEMVSAKRGPEQDFSPCLDSVELPSSWICVFTCFLLLQLQNELAELNLPPNKPTLTASTEVCPSFYLWFTLESFHSSSSSSLSESLTPRNTAAMSGKKHPDGSCVVLVPAHLTWSCWPWAGQPCCRGQGIKGSMVMVP